MFVEGEVHWTELLTWDAEKACQFYADTVGWTFDSMPMPDGSTYYIAKVGDKMICGIFPMNEEEYKDVPESWLTYFAVANVDDVIAKMVKGGGHILKEPFEVPGVGRIAMMMDSGGAVSGWMTPADS